MAGMDVVATVRLLNRLRKQGVIPPYAIVGGVAADIYGVVRYTKDLDIMARIDDTFGQFASVWSGVRSAASDGRLREQAMYIPEGNTWLDILATGRDSLDEEIIRTARRVHVEDVTIPVARMEYVIVKALQSWRPDPDYSRVAMLYSKADKARLADLLERYDDETQTLRKRLDYIVTGHP